MKAAIILATLAIAAPASAGKHRDRTAEIERAIEASLPEGLGTITIEVPAALVKARGAVHIDWARAARAGWTSVEVSIGAKESWVRVELGVLHPVVVAMHELDAGHVIVDGDLGIAELPTAGIALDIGVLDGALVLRDVAARAAVSDLDVELPPAIARGTELDVVIRRGSLTVTSRGTTEADARIGELVGVRLASTHLVVRGRLADGGIVEVTP